jgi:4'-phosphopantetheinyl transferase EntD
VSEAWTAEAVRDLADGLFPHAVRALCRPVEDADDDLHPAERGLVANAVPKRRREFAAGRRAARELLASLGAAPGPLLRGADRAPVWPAGLVGSISHCDALCAVAVARTDAAAGVGIDVEPDLPIDEELWSRICTPAEVDQVLGDAPPAERGRVARLVFSAKEAFYKSVSAHVGRVLGFHEVTLQVDWRTGRFIPGVGDAVARTLPGGRPPEGRFARRGGFLLTGATLAAPDRTTGDTP